MSVFTTAEEIGSISHISRVIQYINEKLKIHFVLRADSLICCHATDPDYVEFNEQIDLLDFSRLDDTIIIAILRCTYQVKDHLPSWTKWVQSAKSVFDQRGHDSKKVLCGLLPPDQV